MKIFLNQNKNNFCKMTNNYTEQRPLEPFIPWKGDQNIWTQTKTSISRKKATLTDFFSRVKNISGFLTVQNKILVSHSWEGHTQYTIKCKKPNQNNGEKTYPNPTKTNKNPQTPNSTPLRKKPPSSLSIYSFLTRYSKVTFRILFLKGKKNEKFKKSSAITCKKNAFKF